MAIETTNIHAVSETRSRVHMVIADEPEPRRAGFHVDVDVEVEHSPNPLIAEVQLAVLRSVRKGLEAENLRLESLVGERG